MIIPRQLAISCSKTAERQLWLERLPGLLKSLSERWELTVGAPFDHAHITASWVAPARRADGSRAVLKIALPHMEGADEIPGLRAWNGDPTVLLLEADREEGAMLLERCEPGAMLRAIPEPEQDTVVAALLRRLWRCQPDPGLFRPLSEMLLSWRAETLGQSKHWLDAGLVKAGLDLMMDLSGPRSTDRLLATDLHAGNVLQSQREPWLVIDPKPFVGDCSYDVVQHLINCQERLHADPLGMVRRLADLTGVDHERLRLWTFARAASEPRANWSNQLWIDIALALAP